MLYNVFIERNAEKDLKKLPKEIREKIKIILIKLKNNSKPLGIRKISGLENYFRLRAGNYRIIYEINDKINTLNF